MNILEMINPTEISVLLAGSLHHDETAIERIFSDSGWRLKKARTIAETMLLQRYNPFVVILCEELLPDGDWRMLLAKVYREPRPPLLIVASPSADGGLASEVLNAGGFDLLCTPFDRLEVVHTVKSAWLSWHLQWNVNRKAQSANANEEFPYLPPAA